MFRFVNLLQVGSERAENLADDPGPGEWRACLFHSEVHLRMSASSSVTLRCAERRSLRFADSANCRSVPNFQVCTRCVLRPNGCRIRETADCDMLVAAAIDRVDGCVCCAAVARAGGDRLLAPGRTALGAPVVVVWVCWVGCLDGLSVFPVGLAG